MPVQCRCRCCRKAFMSPSGAAKWCERPECQAHKEKKQAEIKKKLNKKHNPDTSRRRNMLEVEQNKIRFGAKKYKCQNDDCGIMSFNRFYCPRCTDIRSSSYANINGVLPG